MSDTTATSRRLLAKTVRATEVDPSKARAFIDAVGNEIVAAMAAADHAASSTARCIATFIEERSAQQMPLAIGLDEMELAATTLASQLKARRETIGLKLALWRIPPQIDVTDWGPWCPCEQDIAPATEA